MKDRKSVFLIAWGVFWTVAFLSSMAKGRFGGIRGLIVFLIIGLLPIALGVYLKQRHRHRREEERIQTERAILLVASRNKGRVSVAQAAIESGLSLDDARNELDRLVKAGFADYELDEKGNVFYRVHMR